MDIGDRWNDWRQVTARPDGSLTQRGRGFFPAHPVFLYRIYLYIDAGVTANSLPRRLHQTALDKPFKWTKTVAKMIASVNRAGWQ